MTEPTLLRGAEHAWEAYQPTAADPWDAAKVAHLHRRAGFGATWAQIQRDVADGYETSLKRVLQGEAQAPDGRPAGEIEDLVTVMADSAQRNPSIERVQLLWLFRMLFTQFPLAEKMTLTWHSHYASSAEKVREPRWMLGQNFTQRAHWRARISRLHLGMLRDPAMLKWLDGTENSKGQPNENLGREFLELFSLGEGNYTEADVRETARALTGWQEVGSEALELLPNYHDDGPKTVLGAKGNWGDDDVVRIVCRQPAAARHIARRLYRTFISDTEEPSATLIEPLAESMRVDGDVDVARGLERVLRSRLFHSPVCRGKRVKSPVEYVIGALRGCETFSPAPDLSDIEIHLTKMGQRLFYPPTVAGWPGGLAWLRGSTVLARANFAASFANPDSSYGPSHLADVAKRHGWNKPEQWIEALSTVLLGAPLRDSKKTELHALCRKTTDPAQYGGRIVQYLLSLPEAQMC